MKRMLLTLLAALGLIVPSLRAQDVWDGTTIDTSWYDPATADTTTSYEISTAAELAGLAKLVNGGNTFQGKTITLSANVDLAGKAWTPIGDKESKKYFKGTFIGQPKEAGEGAQVLVSNLSINLLSDASKDYQALFGAIEGATIKNLKATGSVRAKNAAGIVARMDGGTVENCTNAVTIDCGASKAGGIVCLTTLDCVITNCTNEGTLQGSAGAQTHLGGILGYGNGETTLVSGCTNKGTINGETMEWAGGIVGYATSKGVSSAVENCTNEGSIIAKTNAGGIIAYSTQLWSVSNSTNSGTITSASTAGGIVGTNNNAGAIVECGNTGVITGKVTAGGVVGNNASGVVDRCTNSGEVSAMETPLLDNPDNVNRKGAGGIVGSNTSGILSVCENTGKVTGYNAGGVAGYCGAHTQLIKCSGGKAEIVALEATQGGYAGRLIGNCNTGYSESDAILVTVDDTKDDDYTSLPTLGAIAPLSGWGQLKVLAGTFHGTPATRYVSKGTVANLYFSKNTAWGENTFAEGSVWTTTSPDAQAWTSVEKTSIAMVGDTPCYTLTGIAAAKKATPEAAVVLSAEASNFNIANITDLKAFRDLVNAGVTFRGKTVTLMANIDLKNEEWTPIGKNSTAVFRGTFDGTGKTISNLKISGTNDNVGLFGATNYTVDCSPSAGLKNLTLSNVSVSGGSYVGALAGNYYDKYVTNCHVTGTIAISGKKYVGGLIGKADATLTDCSVKGTAEAVATIVADSEDAANVGGLVGILGEHNYTVTNCATEYVSLSGDRKVGGLIGTAYVDDSIVGCSASHISITATPDASYVETKKSSLGFGGLVGIYTQHKSSAGSLIACAVEDITFTVREEAVADALSMGAVTGGFLGSSAGPVDVSDKLATTVGITVSNATGAMNDYLADVPACVYPTEKFGSASAFIKDFPEGKTVYDGETYHATMVEALQAIHKTGKNTLWCKPGADVGTMTHGHVCQSLTVYGNGATVTGGEHDFELDNTTTPSSEYGDCPEQAKEDVTLKIVALNQVAVWGANIRERVRTVTLEDCKDVYRVYLTSANGHAFVGTNNITLKRCTGTAAYSDGRTSYCKVFSIVPGTIVVEDCTFTGVPEPINLRNRSAGNQKVTVTNCTFTDCATTAIADTVGDEAWAAPIRVCVTDNPAGSTDLTVTNCTFNYTAGTTKCNGDILMGEGRDPKSWNSYPTVTTTIVNTAAEVYVLQPGDRTAEGVTPTKTVNVAASATETVIKNTLPIAEVDGVAYDTLPEVVAAIENKVAAGATAVTVKLLSDVSVENTTLSIPNKFALTLDLNGKTYTYTDSDATDSEEYAIMLNATSTLTVTDSSTDQTGTMKAVGTALCCLNNNGGTLNVLGGNFVMASTSSSYAIFSQNGASTIIEPVAEKSIALTGGLHLGGSKKVRIAGKTTITGQGTYYAIYVGDSASNLSVEIEDGTFNKSDSGDSVIYVHGGSAATFDISGGTFTGKFGGDGTGTYTLSGGSYSVDPTTTASPSTVTLKPNYLPVLNAEDYFVVGPFVVAITEGDAKGGYTTLQKAVDVANGAPVQLLCDLTLDAAVTLEEDVNLDLNGHTLYAKDKTTPAFTATTSVKLTVSSSKDGGKWIAPAQGPASNVTVVGLKPQTLQKWTDEGAYTKFSSIEGKRITITSAQELAYVCVVQKAKPTQLLTYEIVLANDIDLRLLEWEPIPNFGGTFDGQGHTISGVDIKTAKGTCGFFESLTGTVQNVRFADATITVKPEESLLGDETTAYGGVVTGMLGSGNILNCVVENCKVTASESATSFGVGGFVGQATDGALVQNCAASGNTFSVPEGLSGKTFIGDPTEKSSIVNCYVDGALAQDVGKLTDVYSRGGSNNTFRRDTTADNGWVDVSDLSANAVLNGIGWVLNKQKEDGSESWRVDSNENPSRLLPFPAEGEAVTIPVVEHTLTEKRDLTFPNEAKKWHCYFANGSRAFVKVVDGKTVLTTQNQDYWVDEVLTLETKSATSNDLHSQVAVFGGSYGGTIAPSDSFDTSYTLTVQDCVGTLPRVFGGSYSSIETPSVIKKKPNVSIDGGTITKVYGGSCGEVSSMEAGAQVTCSGGTIAQIVAASNGGDLKGTAEIFVWSGKSFPSAKLYAVEYGTAESVTFTLNGYVAEVCLTGTGAYKASVTKVTLSNGQAAQGKTYLGTALASNGTFDLQTRSAKFPITVLAQTAATAEAETVIPVGQTVTIGTNVTLQVPANVTLKVAGTVNISGSLVGTSGTSLLEVLEGASATSLPQGLSSWDVLTSKWVQAQIKASNGTYYGTVAQALAALAADDTVTLLSRDVATENVLATSAGKTVYSGDAYDVADVLGGVFTVTVENNTPRLVYAYDLGVGGLTIRRAAEGETAGTDGLVVEVTVKLAEGGTAPAGKRELADCTLTVTSILDKNETTKQDFTLKGLTFTEGECKVTIPYTEENFPMGTNRLTVSVSKGEATPPAEGGGETP